MEQRRHGGEQGREAERRQWLRREKKCVYASRDLERAYAITPAARLLYQ